MLQAGHPPRRRRLRRLAIGVVVALALGAGALGWAQPTLAALVCPRCFGFERLSGDLFVEGTMSPEQRAGLRSAVAEAERRVLGIYGEVHSSPIVLACGTETCWHRLGGRSARGGALGTSGLRLSPRGLNPVIIAHELSHIELHHRIGLWRFARGAVPAWFDEGFAVIVSDDDRYLLPAAAGDRCRAEPDTTLPTSQREWPRRAGADHTLYARAACRVSRWMARNGGSEGILTLLDRVRAGDRFDALVSD